MKPARKLEVMDEPVLATPPTGVSIDSVAVNRSLPIPDPASVIDPPTGFRASEGEVKQALLKVPEGQRAEIKDALVEARDKGEGLKEDLGRFAPSAEMGGAILERMAQARAFKQRALALVEFAEEVEDIAHHDAMTFFGSAKKELLHVADHDPSIAKRYPAMMALAEQRRDAIALGRARAVESRRKSKPE